MRSKEREAEKKNASEKKEKSTAQNILGTIAYIVGQWTESCYGQAFLSIP